MYFDICPTEVYMSAIRRIEFLILEGSNAWPTCGECSVWWNQMADVWRMLFEGSVRNFQNCASKMMNLMGELPIPQFSDFFGKVTQRCHHALIAVSAWWPTCGEYCVWWTQMSSHIDCSQCVMADMWRMQCMMDSDGGASFMAQLHSFQEYKINWNL